MATKTAAEIIAFFDECDLEDKRLLTEHLARDLYIAVDRPWKGACTCYGSDEIVNIGYNGDSVQIFIRATPSDSDLREAGMLDPITTK